jgi:hypothetical protein
MSVRSIVLAAVLSTAFVVPAFARDAVFTVKLEAPVAAQTRVIAQNEVWTCGGDTCLARVDHDVTVRACRQFVREAGDVRITSYGTDGRELSADEIARCNGDTVATQQAQN